MNADLQETITIYEQQLKKIQIDIIDPLTSENKNLKIKNGRQLASIKAL